MRKLRALVADDDAELLDMVAAATERFGAEVTKALSGYELLARLADSGPFDFVVTDVSMPWMTGLQVMHASRTAGLPIPVIIMTALRDPRVFAQTEALGAHTTLLLKPFTTEELFAALRGCVAHLPPREPDRPQAPHE
jgi:CheY-like chemotaxis protein